MSVQESISEKYAVALSNNEPSNYTMFPNIVDHLTYDDIDEETGQKLTRRLSVYAIHLYRILRSIAGNENTSWKSTEQLAEISNMSKGQVANCKKELQQKFHQLDGKPLIEIKEKKKVTLKQGAKLNGTIYHTIHIPNIWCYNRAFFVTKKFEKEARSPNEHAEGARSPNEHAEGARSPNEHALEGARSPGERNNITEHKTPLYKEQHSTARAVPVVSSVSYNKEFDVSGEEKTKVFNWLMKIGCDELCALDIISSYPIEDIRKAHLYVIKQIEKKSGKNEKISNPIAYLRQVLKNKWWEQKSA